MTWLKRNLILVMGGVVALALLAAAGFFLFTSYRRDRDASGKLVQEADQITRLNQSDPSITPENIEASKTEQERVRSKVEEYRKYFAPVGSYTNIDDSAFKFLLANTLSELNALAESQGVRRPKDFAYTFDTQRGLVVFNANELLPWTYQLLEIKTLCETVYRARVHSVLRILRPSVSTNDNAQVVLRGATMKTNTVVGAVTTPYEITFQGFSSELAAVLEGFARLPQCFLVKNINVEKSPAAVSTGPSEEGGRYGTPVPMGVPTAPPPSLSDRYGLNPGASRYGPNPAASRYASGGAEAEMQRRYGIGPGGTTAPPPPTTYAPAASTARRGPETVLDEHLLRFTLRLEAVRPWVAAK